MSLVLYSGAPWEKRLNLYKHEFFFMRQGAPTIIEQYDRIERQCKDGVPFPTPYKGALDDSNRVGITVTVYQGIAKIHVGTEAYCTEVFMRTLARMAGSPPLKRSLPPGGHVIPITVFRQGFLGEIGEKIANDLNNDN